MRLHANRWPGSGVPFLLVHGLASNARLWDGVALALSAAGCDVTAVDLRGHGLSDKPDSGYDFATVVSDLVALGLDRPVAVGQSWGGNVVLEMAASAPSSVRGIACVDGGHIELSRRFPRWEDCAEALRPPPLEGRQFSELEAYAREAMAGWPESGIQGQFANFEVRADGTIAPWLTLDRHMKILRSLWEHHPAARAGLVQCPALLVMAEGDDDKREDVARLAAALPDVEVAWMEGDHDLHAQHPEAVAKLLLERFT